MEFSLKTKYIPFIVLTALFVIKLLLLLTVKSDYNFDEYITTEIAKQPLNTLMETVMSQNHPPVFYIFIKVFPLYNVVFSRIAMSIVTFSIIFTGFFIGLRSKLFQNNYFVIALSVFMVSVNFLEITTYLKTTTLGFSLALLVFFIILSGLKSKNITLKSFIFLSLITTLIGSIDYLHFFYAVIMIVAAFITNKNRFYFSTLATVSLTFFTYIYSFGYLHFNSVSRVSWINYYPNNFFTAITMHFLNINTAATYVEILMLIAILFIITGFYSKKLYTKNFKWALSFESNEIYTLCLTILLFFVAPFIKLYVAPRYSAILFLLTFTTLSVIIAKIMFIKINKYFLITILLTLLFFSTIMSAITLHGFSRLIRKINLIELNENSPTVIFGYRASHIYLIKHCCNNGNLYPVSLQNPDFYAFLNRNNNIHITRTVLDYDKNTTADIGKLKNSKTFNSFNTFYFFKRYKEFDEANKVYETYFNEICQKNEAMLTQANAIIKKYSNCNTLDF